MLDIQPGSRECFSIHVHEDAPFAEDTLTGQVGIIRAKTAPIPPHAESLNNGLHFVVMARSKKGGAQNTRWRVLKAQNTTALNGFRQDFHGFPVTAGVDAQLEFVVYATVMSSLAFHVRGLLECPPGDLSTCCGSRAHYA